MRPRSVLISAVALACAIMLEGFATTIHLEKPTAAPPTLSLAIVPGREGITMAQQKPDDFYLVLTNISERPQRVWEDWNSWGYYAISFEMTTADGEKFAVTRRPIAFTRNAPSTFVVEPGEHQVYVIRIDKWWQTHPSLPKVDEMPISLEAIYQVPSTREATQNGVWTGHLESHNYRFVLRQW